ncbi:MAG TPA: 16S rRNA (cytidine(1402)-2'-O)-methyltransferase [Gemmatimonadaceae bacterium]
MTDGQSGTLFVVSTPIGNMGEFSFRAVEILRQVDAILAEDTRHTGQLLKRYEIDRRMIAYHEHNEAKSTPGLVERLRRGESFALVTDAGTPILSDPGARLVAACIEAGVSVVPIPGASALLAALVVSGLPADRFTFFGFLPRTGRDRAAAMAELSSLSHTAVLYEAPNRVAATLADLAEVAGADRPVVVAREMTKQFEEIRRGTLAELSAYYENAPPRGEVVILLGAAAPRTVDDTTVRERVKALRASGLSARDTATAVARELGVSKRAAYQMTQEEK